MPISIYMKYDTGKYDVLDHDGGDSGVVGDLNAFYFDAVFDEDSSRDKVIVLGDLNAYAVENPTVDVVGNIDNLGSFTLTGLPAW